MSVIERCWIGTHERLTGPVIVWTAQEAGERRRNGWEMVEYVPADQLQGAVEDYDRCRKLLEESEAEVERLKDRAQHLRRALDACQSRTG